MTELMHASTTENRRHEALRQANELFSRAPDYMTFFRDVHGPEGVVRKLFPEAMEAEAFTLTPEFKEIERMCDQLREAQRHADEGKEPTRVITVRLPAHLHEALKDEAHNFKTSMNRLCIAKLVQAIDAEDLRQTKEKEKKADRAASPNGAE